MAETEMVAMPVPVVVIVTTFGSAVAVTAPTVGLSVLQAGLAIVADAPLCVPETVNVTGCPLVTVGFTGEITALIALVLAFRGLTEPDVKSAALLSVSKAAPTPVRIVD